MEDEKDYIKIFKDFINRFPPDSRPIIAFALYSSIKENIQIALSNYYEMQIKGFELNGNLEEDTLTVKKYKEYLQNGGEINEEI